MATIQMTGEQKTNKKIEVTQGKLIEYSAQDV